MTLRRLLPVLLAGAALSCAAQDLSLNDDEPGLTLDEPAKKPAKGKKESKVDEEFLKKAKADKDARLLAQLKRFAETAEKQKQREDAQQKVLSLIRDGEEKVDYAVSVRDAKDTSDGQRVFMARWLAGEIRVEFGIWGTHWYREYCENWPDDKLARYEREYFASLDVLERLAPKDIGSVHRHADALLYRYTRKGDRADAVKSRDLFRREIALRKGEEKQKDAYGYCAAWWGYVNAVFAVDGAAAAVSALDEFRATKAKMNWGRRRRGYTGLMGEARMFLAGEPLDAMKLPFHTESKAFPEPQEFSYAETFAAAPAMRVVAKGIDRGDIRFHLLEVKLRRLGIAVKDDAPFEVTVEVDPATKAFRDLRDPQVFAKVRERKFRSPVGKDGKPKREDRSPEEFRDYMENEAYVLEVTEKGAKIVAKTKQGALWGIVSLIQMTDRDRKAVRIGRLRDWPDVEKRGFLCEGWASALEFALFQKMNSIDHQHHPCFSNTFEPLTWHMEKETGRLYHELGIELFFGMNWITHAPQLPMAYPRTLPYRVEIMKRYAKEHIGVYYPLDDIRFPVEKPDLDKFGSAAAIDGKHQTAIWKEVVKEYPDWRFVVCPPFYWGPDGRSHFYPETQHDYLTQWKKDLDPAIEAYWTGGRVKSWGLHKYQNDWALKNYDRRPYLFQNGMGWHGYLDYTIDAMNWPDIYDKGTLDQFLKGYHLNACSANASYLSTLGDALWNMGGHDAERSARRGARQLMGEKTYDYLKEGYDDLCYFDKWTYGKCGEEVLAEDLEDLERKCANMSRAWKKANEYAASVGARVWGSYGRGVGWAYDVLAARKRPRNFEEQYKGFLEETRGIAKNETHYDEQARGDVYFSTTRLGAEVVGLLWTTPEDSEERKKEHPRLRAALSGAKARAGLKTISGTFASESFPPQSDYLLCVSGTGKAKVRVKVNDTVVFEGEKTFGPWPRFNLAKFKIPAKALKRTNTFSLENLSEKGLSISYAVVLMSERIRREEMSAEESIIDL